MQRSEDIRCQKNYLEAGDLRLFHVFYVHVMFKILVSSGHVLPLHCKLLFKHPLISNHLS